MANAFSTLAHLAVINGTKLADFEVSDVLESAPLLTKLAAREASERTSHKYLKKTTAAGGAFRAPNAGANISRSNDEAVTINLSVFDASFDCDFALANGYIKGRDAYLGMELKRALKAAFASLEDQIVGGTGNDATGFDGLADMVDGDLTIDLNGQDNNTSTIYMVRTYEDAVAILMGVAAEGTITVSDPYQTRVLDGSTYPYDAWRVPVLGWVGLQGGSKYDIGCIQNVSADVYADVDAAMGELLAKFGNGDPNMIIMHRTVRESLRQSYTDTNGRPVSLLTDWQGIPIVCVRACGAVDVDEISA